jgi:mannose/cellobiose epimerase-like protein (N-acyl-D-glucosamine 2-epimerase family)
MLPDGSFVEEPSPASSFYHIICAIQVMRETIHA